MLQDYAFGLPGEFILVQCVDCGLLYLQQRPKASEIEMFYPTEYLPYKLDIEDERWRLMRWVRRRNIRKYRQVVEKFSARVPGRVLDIGCSTGIFLAEMKEAGWDAYGVELNPNAAEYARSHFGLDVSIGTLEEADLDKDTFTAVTFWDVLEHTRDPQETLCRVHTLLNNKGILIMTVPNYDSWDRHLFKRYWVGYDAPRHFYVFPRPVLSRLLSQAGFEVLRMRCAFGGYHTTAASVRLWLSQVSPLLRTLIISLLEIPMMRLPFLPFEIITDALNVGGKLEVVARKR